jgi:4-hydroxythreonine-4-phosphate dehydrogenase
MDQQEIRIGITHGDINGIGYEVIMKSLADQRILDNATVIIYGSPKAAAFHRKSIDVANLNLNLIKTAEEAVRKKANIINCVDPNIRVEAGTETVEAGEAAFLALKAAVADIKEGKIDVLVTAPINKHNIQSAAFSFPGHTEYLAKEFGDENALMFLVSPNFKVGVLSGHVSLSQAVTLVTVDNILTKLRVMNRSLIQDFGIRKPRIAVLGLNPHSGDQGLIGTEEKDFIVPAINKAREENIMALGAYPPDGFFASGDFLKFDAVLAMYHDQGLIPFKAMFFDDGVNFTAGLSVIRTSPAHGTAYDLVGKNQAHENSFRQALYLAIDVFNKRNEYKNLVKNQLKSQMVIVEQKGAQ